ncbi:MAG: ATP-binding cassette domain-containing protein [Limnobacter sp.]|nr:ATP-binding cassette domain-containing protein [Limnobacter sp.]
MLLGLKQVTYRIGQTVLLDQADFALEERERVALVGRNGTGKSTVFRILLGELQPEDGQLVQTSGLRIGCLRQAVPTAQDLLVEDVVAQGLGEPGVAAILAERLSQHHHLSAEHEKQLLDAQAVLAEHHAWDASSKIQQMIGRFKLQADLPFASLSGGMKRKVMLAQAMVGNPDVLLLDEPTNHLDIPGIELLEEQILQFTGAVIFVSHDRSFMRKLATRVCDLDRGILQSWSGGYEGFLKGKADALAAEEKQTALFDKRLAQEEVWIRRGIEARRTRNEGRVRALKEMRTQFSQRRNQSGKAQIDIQEASQSGKLVAELTDIHLNLGGRQLVHGFSTVVMRGDKIGVLGPNGIGKTTALRVLLGDLKPDSGHIRLGTRLEVAYFDQLRSGFTESQTAVEVIGAGKEFIEMNGKSKHVMGYLQDFLFSPDRARQPVRTLSGGERARLMLAQLFAKPSNVLVLDEPTNDLDIETLELLEERLNDYDGTVLLVSHDREFIDKIVTRCWVFENQGKISEYIGGYDDWLRQRTCDPWLPQAATPNETANNPSTASGNIAPEQAASAPAARVKKRSYKDQRELDTLPARIEALEKRQTELVALIGDPAFYNQPADEITQTQQELSKLETTLLQAYSRWTELDQ